MFNKKISLFFCQLSTNYHYTEKQVKKQANETTSFIFFQKNRQYLHAEVRAIRIVVFNLLDYSFFAYFSDELRFILIISQTPKNMN